IKPRGGVETDWWAESVKLYRRLRAVERAAQAVVEETDKIHDNDPAPVKFRAPYGAITELRRVLALEPTIDERKLSALSGKPYPLAPVAAMREAVDDAWRDLVEKDDRTSPEGAPDMALITRDELAAYMA